MISEIKVASNSPIGKVAGAIAKALRRNGTIKVRAVGVNAVYCAIRAMIKARSYLANDGLDLVARPNMSKATFDGAERYAIVFDVRSIKLASETSPHSDPSDSQHWHDISSQHSYIPR